MRQVGEGLGGWRNCDLGLSLDPQQAYREKEDTLGSILQTLASFSLTAGCIWMWGGRRKALISPVWGRGQLHSLSHVLPPLSPSLCNGCRLLRSCPEIGKLQSELGFLFLLGTLVIRNTKGILHRGNGRCTTHGEQLLEPDKQGTCLHFSSF